MGIGSVGVYIFYLYSLGAQALWVNTTCVTVDCTLTLDQPRGDPQTNYVCMYGRALRTAAGSRVVRVNDAQVGKVIFQVRQLCCDLSVFFFENKV